jgi:hypothetical protein
MKKADFEWQVDKTVPGMERNKTDSFLWRFSRLGRIIGSVGQFASCSDPYEKEEGAYVWLGSLEVSF